ncbi:unnamed protein product [Amoebophrya sp. A120]|nr:unnamed protein product [Amoebophrya sp. A120]|eukprot:GSA120T00006652001.1
MKRSVLYHLTFFRIFAPPKCVSVASCWFAALLYCTVRISFSTRKPDHPRTRLVRHLFRTSTLRGTQQDAALHTDEDAHENEWRKRWNAFSELGAEDAQSTKITLLPVVDAAFSQKNRLQLQLMDCYAKRHGYGLTVLVVPESGDACSKHKNFFFRKHCAVANFIQDSAPPSSDEQGTKKDKEREHGAWWFVFDSDVAVSNMHLPLTDWILQQNNAARRDIQREKSSPGIAPDLIFYERGFNSEIMAGNYAVRRTEFALKFLREWASHSFEEPLKPSYDQSAIHMVLLDTLEEQRVQRDRTGRNGSTSRSSREDEREQALDITATPTTAREAHLLPQAAVAECRKEYQGLGIHVGNNYGDSEEIYRSWHKYYRFLSCCKKLLGPPREWQTPVLFPDAHHDDGNHDQGVEVLPMQNEFGRIRVLPRWHSWVVDMPSTKLRCSGFHPFQHGVKGAANLISLYPQYANRMHFPQTAKTEHATSFSCPVAVEEVDLYRRVSDGKSNQQRYDTHHYTTRSSRNSSLTSSVEAAGLLATFVGAFVRVSDLLRFWILRLGQDPLQDASRCAAPSQRFAGRYETSLDVLRAEENFAVGREEGLAVWGASAVARWPLGPCLVNFTCGVLKATDAYPVVEPFVEGVTAPLPKLLVPRQSP